MHNPSDWCRVVLRAGGRCHYLTGKCTFFQRCVCCIFCPNCVADSLALQSRGQSSPGLQGLRFSLLLSLLGEARGAAAFPCAVRAPLALWGCPAALLAGLHPLLLLLLLPGRSTVSERCCSLSSETWTPREGKAALVWREDMKSHFLWITPSVAALNFLPCGSNLCSSEIETLIILIFYYLSDF